MKSKNVIILMGLCILCGLYLTGGCDSKSSDETQPEIAVANSYLLSVVKDILGSQTEIISLVPPGMCPGHFDISPRQVEQLTNCKMLLVFDFQSRISDALLRICQQGLKIHEIKCPEGLCVPETYLAITQSVADALADDDPAKREEYEKQLELIAKRLDKLESEIHTKIRQWGFKGATVISSVHQAVFVGWLGLDVAATFEGNDTETPTGINRCLQQAKDRDIKFVIANKQEGSDLAKALAERLGAKMVVFSNFPADEDGGDEGMSFDSLLLENVTGLSDSGE